MIRLSPGIYLSLNVVPHGDVLSNYNASLGTIFSTMSFDLLAADRANFVWKRFVCAIRLISRRSGRC